MFITEYSLASGTWQAFERNICRLLIYEGYSDIRLVGRPNDQGADIITHRNGKRWLIQAKHWKNKVGVEILDQTVQAMQTYRAHIPAIVALSGFSDEAREHQRVLMSRGIFMQLIDAAQLAQRAAKLAPDMTLPLQPKDYQEEAIRILLRSFTENQSRKALVVMATGLGKTMTTAETIRRAMSGRNLRVLVIAHTNEIVYQLERAFWPFIPPKHQTMIWNGYEQPSREEIESVPFVFACLNSVASYIDNGGELPQYDIIVVDECHHVGGSMYQGILQHTAAGQQGGPFLIGLTATPWRPDETDLRAIFGDPLVCVDMVTGLRRGFLSNVDYRLYTDNINWSALAKLHGARFSPRNINRTLFITQWDDAVVRELRAVWNEIRKPRCIVFCGTIDHAITMRDRVNALGFCNAAAIYSQTAIGGPMSGSERTRTMCDFHDGITDVICAVDIFNEGVDVPDVNLIVFQRVTHSRRIFIQQLGRGLRLAREKSKVIVLDFVSDIRRFAAGLELKDNLAAASGAAGARTASVSLPHKVTFCRAGAEDPESETFLRQWLEDVAEVEAAGEDASVLKYPPKLPGGKT
jgi:superfamily II DNA or RNA helicase